MASVQDRFDALGARLLAISTDDFTNASYIPERPEITFPLLWDASRETVQKYGVLNGKLPHPSTFVIDADGIIRWKRVDADYTNRPSASSVLTQVEALTP